MLHYIKPNDPLWFPPVEAANEEGLLAYGGDLSIERLLLAYQSGIFPWFNEGEPPLWWSPDPRMVLFPDELVISKSMRSVLRKETFEFRVNTAFERVIRACAATPRPSQDGTWITDDIINAYTELHRLGYAHSAEAWQDGKLVGGLYGIRIGHAFFGESMFAHAPNASKAAFIPYVQLLATDGVEIIDCQVYTPHLESLGARGIEREEFLGLIKQ